MAASVVAIETSFALRDPGQLLNPEEAEDPAISKIGQSGTVLTGPFRRRYKGASQILFTSTSKTSTRHTMS